MEHHTMSDTAEKTFTQAELDSLIKERLARQASKFADYEELRAKVQQYETAASTSQTELEKLQTTVAELTAKSARNEREALIARIARDHKIDDGDDIELFLTGADEATLTAQAARLATRNAATAETAAKAAEDAQRANIIVPTEGHTHPAPPLTERDADLAFMQAIGEALNHAGNGTTIL